MNMGSSTLNEQAGVVKITKNQSHQNVTFVDGDNPFVHGYKTGVEGTRQQQDQEIATLEEFLSRPVKIANLSWGNATPSVDFAPWDLFFNNARVANRLNNYNLLRATLKVKFVVNGNAFYYGRQIAAYKPFTSSDSLSSFDEPEDIMQLSQLPHILLDPTTSTGGVLTCPFFYFKNYVNIPTSEYSLLGTIYVKTLPGAFLRHANDPDFPNLTISVFAWAEDVQMSVLTSVNTSTLIPQAGEIEEANRSGVVSGPATTIARVANALGRIPYIKPYAKATELAASAVSSIASSFGYCRPSVTKAPDFVKMLPSSSFALTNAPDTSLKLSVDHKQESTVDPRISGIEEEDMLSIVNIAKRESWIESFNWRVEDSTNSTLWNTRVTPVTWTEANGGQFRFPATAMAALPFRYWTGTLNYRFLVVCSGFHKGRLAITWDPNFVASSAVELNTLYSEIIDIAETTDFTISISNGQSWTMIRNTIPGITTTNEIYSQTRYSSPEDFANGVLHVSVMNSLTVASTAVINTDVSIQVFISAGDDFKVFVPWDHFQNFVPTVPVPAALLAEEPLEEQSGTLIGTNDSDNNSPEGHDEHILYKSESDDYTNLVFTGEAIPSFRAMVKRYSLWRSILPTLSAAAIECATNWKFAIYPFQRGRYGNAPDVAVGGINYAYCNTLLLHWVSYAFAGFRGNMRYKVVPRSITQWGGSSPVLNVLRFGSENTNTEYAATQRFNLSSFTNGASAARTAIRSSPNNHETDFTNTGTQGMAWIDVNSTGILEFEVPFYSQYRFAGTRHLGWTQADTWGLGGYYLQYKGSANNKIVYDIYSAAGEDFQTYFFMGLPVMYYEPTPPAVA